MGEDAYIAAETFEGAKEGYAFKSGEHGTGYYKDVAPEVTYKADAAALAAEQASDNVKDAMAGFEEERLQEQEQAREMMELMELLLNSAAKPDDASDVTDLETAKAEIMRLRALAIKYPRLFEEAGDPPPPLKIEVEPGAAEGAGGGEP